jgi:hypothetical protein
MDKLFELEFEHSGSIDPPTPSGNGQAPNSDTDVAKRGDVGERLLMSSIGDVIQTLSVSIGDGKISDVKVEPGTYYHINGPDHPAKFRHFMK